MCDGVNIVAEMGGSAVTVEMACRRDITQSFLQNGQNMKIFEGLSNSKNIVFDVKKL